MENRIVLAILVGFIVTWLPRVVPFVLVKRKPLPVLVVKLLRFLPLSIIFALTLSSIMDESIGNVPGILPIETVASVATLYTVMKTKNMLLAVIVGVLVTACLRFVIG